MTTENEPRPGASIVSDYLTEYQASATPEMLNFLADARLEYLQVKEPDNWDEIQSMSTEDLIIWVESTTARKLAGYAESPSSAWGWLPSWRWDEWAVLTERSADHSAIRCAIAAERGA